MLPRGMSGQEAYCAAMCTLCRRLSRAEARDVYLALPRPLQRLIEDCALVNRGEQSEILDREQFVRRVAERLQVDRDHAEAITRTVFAAVETVLPTKEIHDVASQLPRELKTISGPTTPWPWGGRRALPEGAPTARCSRGRREKTCSESVGRLVMSGTSASTRRGGRRDAGVADGAALLAGRHPSR